MDVARRFTCQCCRSDELASIRAAFPAEGLFAEKDLLLSPDPFPIDEKFAKELEQLGHRLFVFQRACNELYQRSVKGKQPAWIAHYLDAGKPAGADRVLAAETISRRPAARHSARSDPDRDGYTIAEIDSVPGGIGLTGWLNQTYAALGARCHRRRRRNARWISELAARTAATSSFPKKPSTYRPEMNWVAAQLNA